MEDKESFRDHIATVDEKGKRIWMYPKKPKGKFFNKRQVFSYTVLALLFAIPHIKIGGEPLLLFNFLERKFTIFGKVFWPQDFHLFAIAMIAAIVFVTLFTVVYGRVFCGWACPQTVFMEMVFRRIEYFIEGDWTKQKKLNKQPWNKEKIIKKTTKHVLFWGVSFLISNTFLAYIIGAEKLWEIQMDDPMNHIGGLSAILIFSFVFYGVFAFLREQVCTTICPYGRLQGALLDRKSIVVAYDHKRGEREEGRSKFRKNENRQESGKGDCIDCSQCVHVCPTGIDIRNGTQLECVNCTACIDACDHMMDGVGLEKGLIRFVSEEGIETGAKFKWTSRNISYTAVLAVILAALTFLVATRSDFEATITRARGTLYQKIDKDHLSNIYNITLVNKTNIEYDIVLKLEEGKGEVKYPEMHLDAKTQMKKNFPIIIERKDFTKGKLSFIVGVYGNGELIETVETTFVGPSL